MTERTGESTHRAGADHGARRYLVWGGGGHGKVIADLVRALGASVAGYVDADPAKLGAVVEPGGSTVVIGEDEFLAGVGALASLPCGADAVVLAVGDNVRRAHCLTLLAGYAAPALVHPSTVASPSVALGRGSVVFPGGVLNAASEVGAGVIVNSGVIVEHDCMVGDGVHLSPRVTLCGGVSVGPLSWIGAGATVIPGVRIGRGVRVGAGAVVVRDVPDGQTVVGVPARARG